MNQVTVDMMLKYPSMLPINLQQTEFQGYLPVNGTDYKLHIKEVDGKPTLVEWNLQLQDYKSEITNLSESHIVTFLDNLTEIISAKTPKYALNNFTEIYRHILNEYVELKEFYISIHKSTILQDLSQIKISHIDQCHRSHDLAISTQLNQPDRIFKVHQHGFPEKANVELFQAGNSLKEIYEKFMNVVEDLQNIFDFMDNLDHCAWSLDPEKPSRKDCYRRIVLDTNVSVIITVDPWNSTIIPDLKLLGPERIVERFRRNLAANLINWNASDAGVDAVLKLLGLEKFPARPDETSNQEVLLCNVGECCICFSLRLNNTLPEIICPNSSCEQQFHKECLYQWLISVNARQCFNELNGKCPNCEKNISCPL